MIIYGLNPVLEALRAGRVRKLRVGPRSDRRVDEAIALAQEGRRADRARRRARRSIGRRGAACIRASPRTSTRRATTAIEELVAAAAPERAAPRRARRHRGSAQRRRDPAQHRCGRRARRRAPGAARGVARRRRGQSVGRRGGIGAHCHGRQHRAGARGAEGRWRLDRRPGGRGDGVATTRST